MIFTRLASGSSSPFDLLDALSDTLRSPSKFSLKTCIDCPNKTFPWQAHRSCPAQRGHVVLIDLWCCCLDLVNIPLRATTYFLVLIGVLGSDHLIIRSVCALALNRWFPSFPLSDWLWTTLNLLWPSLPLVYSPSMRLWRGVFLLPLAHSVSVRGFSVLAGLFAPARPRVPCRCTLDSAFCS